MVRPYGQVAGCRMDGAVPDLPRSAESACPRACDTCRLKDRPKTSCLCPLCPLFHGFTGFPLSPVSPVSRLFPVSARFPPVSES